MTQYAVSVGALLGEFANHRVAVFVAYSHDEAVETAWSLAFSYYPPDRRYYGHTVSLCQVPPMTPDTGHAPALPA